MRYIYLFLFALLFISGCKNKNQFTQKELDQFQFYFQELETTCKNGTGTIWGTQLYGPILLFEPNSKQVVSNVKADQLSISGKVFTGQFDETIVSGNQQINWSGKKWSLFTLPLPTDSIERAKLFLDVLFQKHLEKTKITGLETPECSHLNNPDNKLWMRIELEALKEALVSNDEAIQKEHLKMAVAARKMRSLMVGEYFKREIQSDLKIGLPIVNQMQFSQESYTVKARHLSEQLNIVQNSSNFIKSFPTVILPAYALVMSKYSTDWLASINHKTNIIELVNNFFGFEYERDFIEMLNHLRDRYHSSDLEALDQQLIKDKAIEEQKYVSKFDQVPFIFIKITPKTIVESNPLFTYQYYDKGIIYKELIVKDFWGEVNVTDGALINSQQTYLYLPTPYTVKGNSVKADAWKMELNDDYQIIPFEETDKFTISKKSSKK